MSTDLDIARTVQLRPILDIAGDLGLEEEELIPMGRYKAKISLQVLKRLQDRRDGKLILVTGITPTGAGEGKTTVTIGLGQALARLGYQSVVAVREPSLGPCFGMKGGATGGGYSQVLPMEEINLHFTGDIHAVTSAHNLLAAIIDNHLHFKKEPLLDPFTIKFKRCIDLNDRSLRRIINGLGGKTGGVPREDGFEITAASEVMAILTLAADLRDLRERLGRIVVGQDAGGNLITAEDLGAAGAMAVLLRDAMCPNLVQTLEHGPALVHGGPFGNIAHGCNSIVATRIGLKMADYLVTEAGFGSDLGAEKFFDIKCRAAGLRPEAAVLVGTIRALKMHGGVAQDRLGVPDPGAVILGFPNLLKHAENVRKFGIPLVVALNRFLLDSEEELETAGHLCRENGLDVISADVWASGGEGGLELARMIAGLADSRQADFRPLYPLELPLADKIELIAREVYGAGKVTYSPTARRDLRFIEDRGYGLLPVCIAKTQYSFSADPSLHGRPENFTLPVNSVRLSAGAGFVVAVVGDIMTMPGLPRHPAALEMDIDEEGRIHGLF